MYDMDFHRGHKGARNGIGYQQQWTQHQDCGFDQQIVEVRR